jgi:hypothetical protein
MSLRPMHASLNATQKQIVFLTAIALHQNFVTSEAASLAPVNYVQNWQARFHGTVI